MYIKLLNIIRQFTSKIPPEYRKLDYLDMAGINKTIDLGITYIAGKTKVIITAMQTEYNTDTSPIGVKWAIDRMFLRFPKGEIYCMTDCGIIASGVPVQLNKVSTFTIGTSSLKVDDNPVEYATGTQKSYTGTLKMPLYDFGATPFHGRIYSVIVYIDGIEVGNLVPVMYLNDDSRGLYDLNSNKYIRFFDI